MDTSFTGINAVVTGANGEIGRACATELTRLGARVWALDIAFPESPSPRESAGGTVTECRADVTDPAAVRRAFAAAERRHGPVRLLVNAAGGPGRARGPLDTVDDGDWRRVVALNLDGVFHCCREAARSMKAHEVTGAIVNISSGAGRTSSRTGVQAYAAAKAGVIGFTRQIARELGPFGIRVNCVAPGLIDVAGIREEIAGLPREALAAHLAGVPLGRLGKADDLVGPVMFFLSDSARYVTGQTISVDGGSIMLG